MVEYKDFAFLVQLYAVGVLWSLFVYFLLCCLEHYLESFCQFFTLAMKSYSYATPNLISIALATISSALCAASELRAITAERMLMEILVHD